MPEVCNAERCLLHNKWFWASYADEPAPVKPLVGMLHENIKKIDPRKKISAEQKGYHKTLSGLSKAIDKVGTLKIYSCKKY